MEEKEKVKGFNDIGWNNVEEYTKKWVEKTKEETKNITIKSGEEYPSIPNFLKKTK